MKQIGQNYNVIGLRRDCNLPLNDDNIKNMSVSHWKYFIKIAIFKEALLQLQVELSSNRKNNNISCQPFFLKPNDHLIKLPSHLARLVFKAKTRMLDIKINYKRKYKNGLHCPFCSEYDETFEHIFKCNAGLRILKTAEGFHITVLYNGAIREAPRKIGIFFGKYKNYRQEVKCVMQRGTL